MIEDYILKIKVESVPCFIRLLEAQSITVDHAILTPSLASGS